MKKKIVVTGGTGRFGEILKRYKTGHKLFFPTKNQLNILNIVKIKNYLKKVKPDILIHLAGLSRPMKIHDSNIQNSYLFQEIPDLVFVSGSWRVSEE